MLRLEPSARATPNRRQLILCAIVALVPAFGLMVWLGLLVVGILEGAAIPITPLITVPLNVTLLIVLWLVVFRILRSNLAR